MGLFTNKAAKKAEKLMRDAQSRMDDVLASRQAIINPYAGVTDLSGLISNPFANLQVATEAAEFQAEEADLSLASTLDSYWCGCWWRNCFSTRSCKIKKRCCCYYCSTRSSKRKIKSSR